MAVDYGDVRTGIAVCDKLEMLASPVCVITQRDPEKLIKEITELAAKYKAERFVVGLPKNMDSSIGERGRNAPPLPRLSRNSARSRRSWSTRGSLPLSLTMP